MKTIQFSWFVAKLKFRDTTRSRKIHTMWPIATGGNLLDFNLLPWKMMGLSAVNGYIHWVIVSGDSSGGPIHTLLMKRVVNIGGPLEVLKFCGFICTCKTVNFWGCRIDHRWTVDPLYENKRWFFFFREFVTIKLQLHFWWLTCNCCSNVPHVGSPSCGLWTVVTAIRLPLQANPNLDLT